MRPARPPRRTRATPPPSRPRPSRATTYASRLRAIVEGGGGAFAVSLDLREAIANLLDKTPELSRALLPNFIAGMESALANLEQLARPPEFVDDHLLFVQGVLNLLDLQQQLLQLARDADAGDLQRPFSELARDGDLDGFESLAAEINALYETLDREISPAFRSIVAVFFGPE